MVGVDSPIRYPTVAIMATPEAKEVIQKISTHSFKSDGQQFSTRRKNSRATTSLLTTVHDLSFPKTLGTDQFELGESQGIKEAQRSRSTWEAVQGLVGIRNPTVDGGDGGDDGFFGEFSFDFGHAQSHGRRLGRRGKGAGSTKGGRDESKLHF